MFQAFAQSSAANEGNTSTASVNATPDGKAKSVLFATTNAKSPTATDMATASTGNVPASGDIRENSALTSIALILPVLAMDSVLKEFVFAKRDGRGWTARRWIRMRCSVCQIALGMERLMWIRRPVVVTRDGQAKTVLRVSFLLSFFDNLIPLKLFYEELRHQDIIETEFNQVQSSLGFLRHLSGARSQLKRVAGRGLSDSIELKPHCFCHTFLPYQ